MENLTGEQREAVEYILDDIEKCDNNYSNNYTAIKAIAGSGKSSTLLSLAKEYDRRFKLTSRRQDILYMVFNKSMAVEASEKGFPDRTDIRTIHSLAYRHVVAPAGLQIKNLYPSDLKIKIQYQTKLVIIEAINDFSISKYTSYDDYVYSTYEEGNLLLNDKYISLAKDIMKKMAEGEIKCTHAFYLKLFHVTLQNDDGYLCQNRDNTFGLVLFDEAQDAAPVALEIFRLLKAKHKVFVGDNLQNIYGFMSTVSIFDEIKDAKEFPLTKSFRVSDDIARKVQSFCNIYISEDIKFSGIDVEDKDTIRTKAYIFRTNSELSEKAIELNKKGIEFNLTKDISEAYDLPIAIASCRTPHGRRVLEDHKTCSFLVDDSNDYDEYSRAMNYQGKGWQSWLQSKYKGDERFTSACYILRSVGIESLIAIKKILAGRKLEIGASITLTTAHSSKGARVG